MNKLSRYLLPSALILGLACGLALAQNITKGVQLSQDATGPIGVDTANNVYFPNKILAKSTANVPVLSSCGTAPSIVGNDTVGKITTGSVTTTCTITFSTAYNVAPACIVQTQGAATQPTFTTSTTAITMTVDIVSTVYNYICMSQG